MVGKIGLNSFGVGCTLNFMYSPGLHRGTPIHILLRQVMECRSLTEVRDVVSGRVPGQSGNVMVAQADRHGLNFEFAGQEVSEQEISSKFVHTNHHLAREISAGTLTPNTKARYDRASTMISERSGSVDDAVGILSDTLDADYPICAPYKPMLGTHVGTVSTVIMILSSEDPECRGAGQMYIRRGPVPSGTFCAVSVS